MESFTKQAHTIKMNSETTENIGIGDYAFYKIPNEINYDGMVLNKDYFKQSTLESIKDLKTTENDIIVATYMRSGTTWTIEILYLLLNNGDRGKALTLHHDQKHYFLDLTPPKVQHDQVTMAMAAFGSSRILKTHLPVRYLNRQIADSKAKIVVVMRNPKDTLVSLYHFYRMWKPLGPFPGSWDDFFRYFQQKGLLYCDWLEFTRDYWIFKDNPNFLFIHYEDMKSDLKQCVVKLADFLGKQLHDSTIDRICDAVSFETMKYNKTVNNKENPNFKGDIDFIRKGEVGSWKNVFSATQSEYIDTVYDTELRKLGLCMKHE